MVLGRVGKCEKSVMNDAKQSKSNVRWVVVVVLLMLGINGLATRLLENIWVSLRENKSAAYLPLEWWMAAPFTLFVFGVLSALLTSFSGGKNWVRMFCLLCGCKVVFTAVTAFFFSSRLYPDPVEAALQAGLLSLPSLLVHILLSGTLVLFLKEIFVGPIVREEPDYEFLPNLEAETAVSSRTAATEETASIRFDEKAQEASSAFVAEEEAERGIPRPAMVSLEEKPAAVVHEVAHPAEVRVSREKPAVSQPVEVLLPVAEILKSFPEVELAMSPSEIEQANPVVPIPLEDIVPQLSEGRVQVEASVVISAIPPDAFARPRSEVATTFPDGMMELPLREVVSRLPSSVLELPEQEMQPDVDAEYADFFQEPELPSAKVALKQPAAAVAAAPAPPRAGKPAIPAARVETPAEPLAEEALVISDEEQATLERSRDVITLNANAIYSQFPPGAVIREGLNEEERAPDSLLIPLEVIAPGLAAGDVKLHVKYIFPQLPKACVAMSEPEIARSLPNAEVELPLREVVAQLPSHVLALPDQKLQPELEDMPNPFPEETPPVPREAKPVPTAPSCEPLERSEVSDPSDVAATPTKAPVPSFAEMLREPDALGLSIETVVRLLPDGTFQVSPGELKQHVGNEMIRLPRSLVMGQLKEGRVVVPVEVLAAQFAPEHLGMSIEQIKARVAEGFVEVPLREVVGQVLEEIAQPLERQERQPECDEIPLPFGESVAPERSSADRVPVAKEEPTRGRPSEAGAAQPAARVIGASGGLPSVNTPEPQRRDGLVPPAAPPDTQPRRGKEFQPVSHGQDAGAPSPPDPQDGRTIVRALLQKCKPIGISEHLTFSAGDSSVVVLAASNLNREVLAAGMITLMREMHRFCETYRLGEPFKLLISSAEGAVVGAELVRGNPNRLIVLGSGNRNGGGTMSVLLERFEPELRTLPSLMDETAHLQQAEWHGEWESHPKPLQEDGFLKDASEKVVASLQDVGIQHSISISTASGDKLLVVWGAEFDGYRIPTDGVFDVDLFSQYSARSGAGDFRSALLVAQHAYITLGRLPGQETPSDASQVARAVYLLCIFSPTLAEGVVRAKGARAAQSLVL